MEELTEEEKTKIKKRLDRYSPRWAFDKLQETIDLINDLRLGKKQRHDWFIPELISNEDMVGELFLSNFI